ncbi:MAG: Gfo/Idh/MocA family oxidoreductase [Deltaproteobacteria bacterium]|nr:Gfo/Idh/MocA family oxidoreductase [Deltaproteobacteria bacterium]
MGQYHVEKYAALPEVDLIGVYDVDPSRRDEIALRHQTRSFRRLNDLLREVAAVSVAAPTTAHYEITAACLEQGVDVLVEKPITDSSATAKALVDLADKMGRLLQVGHIERFNPAFQTLLPHLESPFFFEAYRWSQWPKRNLDVDVIFDLMIHDIDLALQLFPEKKVSHIEALGSSLSGSGVDAAEARVRFADNSHALFSVSRLSHRAERLLRVHQDKGIFHVDLLSQRIVCSSPGEPLKEIPLQETPEKDALSRELSAFASASLSRTSPLVSAADGLRAIGLAEQIRNAMMLAGV